MKETVFIIDGSGYIFRAYYAVKSMKSIKGVPVNAVYGFLWMLKNFIKIWNPKYMAIVFDTGGKNFRHELYPEYKSNRLHAIPDLVPQFSLIRQLIDAFNIAQFSKVGFEADDIIGTLSVKSRSLGYDVVVISDDKDMMQLVGDNIFLLDGSGNSKTFSRILIKEQDVVSRFGIHPSKIIDVMGLTGDMSDHIPGVRGIGIKTAIELIKEYDNLENVLSLAHKMKYSVKKDLLIRDSDLAKLSKVLVTIDCRVDLNSSIKQLKYGEPDLEKLNHFNQNLGFKPDLNF